MRPLKTRQSYSKHSKMNNHASVVNDSYSQPLHLLSHKYFRNYHRMNASSFYNVTHSSSPHFINSTLFKQPYNRSIQEQPNMFSYYEDFLLSSFLNTTRSGSAHRHFGQSFNQFLGTVLLTVAFAFLQLFIFFVLKEKLKLFYQPNVVYSQLTRNDTGNSASGSYRSSKALQTCMKKENPGNGTKNVWKILYDSCAAEKILKFIAFVSQLLHCSVFQEHFNLFTQNVRWFINLAFHTSIDEYQHIGLDSFCILQFLTVLSQMFLLFSVVIIPILIPIHFYSAEQNNMQLEENRDSNAETSLIVLRKHGLDRISMSSISNKNSNVLVVHFVVTICVVIFFHFVLLKELQQYCARRMDFLHWLQNNHTTSKYFSNLWNAQRTLYFNNPSSLNPQILNTVLQRLGNPRIASISYVPRGYEKLLQYQKTHSKLLKRIESLELDLLVTKTYTSQWHHLSPTRTTRNLIREKLFTLKKIITFQTFVRVRIVRRSKAFSIVSKTQTFNYYKPKFTVHDDISWQTQNVNLLVGKYLQNLQEWLYYKNSLTRKTKNGDNLYNMVFIKFDNIYIANFFKQILIHGNPSICTKKCSNVSYKDIIWANVTRESPQVNFARQCIANFLSTAILIGWVMPVAFIGLMSQIPYMGKIVPFFRSMYKVPSSFRGVIDILVPVLTLIFLTEVVPIFFRWLSRMKGLIKHSDVELNVQQWYYIFTFLHIFIVVTVSSGISAIMKQVIKNPVTIPNLLASNFPKCSNFFCAFMIIKGLSYFSGNLLQPGRLFFLMLGKVCNLFSSRDTPREKYLSITKKTLTYNWGSVYPIFSLLASIAIIYCVIQPIILLISYVAFALILVSFKYTLKYQVSKKSNTRETLGAFYPRALFQIYGGVYCLELFMIGLFILSKCYRLSVLTVFLLIFSIVAHVKIKARFKSLLVNIPLSKYNGYNASPDTAIKSSSINGQYKFVSKMEKSGTHDIIWIPKDKYGMSNLEIRRLNMKFGETLKTSNSHCIIDHWGNIDLV